MDECVKSLVGVCICLYVGGEIANGDRLAVLNWTNISLNRFHRPRTKCGSFIPYPMVLIVGAIARMLQMGRDGGCV